MSACTEFSLVPVFVEGRVIRCVIEYANSDSRAVRENGVTASAPEPVPFEVGMGSGVCAAMDNAVDATRLSALEEVVPQLLLEDQDPDYPMDIVDGRHQSPMRDAEFWRLLEGAPKTASQKRIGGLERSLAKMADEEILSFAQTLAYKMYQIDYPEFDSYSAGGNDSSWIRGASILAGKDVFESVLRSPSEFDETLLRDLSCFVPLLPELAWKRKHKQPAQLVTTFHDGVGANVFLRDAGAIRGGDRAVDKGVFVHALVSTRSEVRERIVYLSVVPESRSVSDGSGVLERSLARDGEHCVSMPRHGRVVDDESGRRVVEFVVGL